MVGMAHVFLHVGLCNAIANTPPDTQIAMRVKMSYAVGGAQIDKVFRFARGDEPQTVVEFDVPRGEYRLQLDVPKYGCSGSDYLFMLPDRDRNIAETLKDGPATEPPPGLLMDGTAPISFLYTKPTFVLFDKSVACNQPVTPPLPFESEVEYDQGSYYVRLHPDASLEPHQPVVVALRLRTPTGSAHYVRIPIAFPMRFGGFPNSIELNVSEDMIDGLATEKLDTLLCLKFWETSVH
jgi:hypothetical protein